MVCGKSQIAFLTFFLFLCLVFLFRSESPLVGKCGAFATDVTLQGPVLPDLPLVDIIAQEIEETKRLNMDKGECSNYICISLNRKSTFIENLKGTCVEILSYTLSVCGEQRRYMGANKNFDG